MLQCVFIHRKNTKHDGDLSATSFTHRKWITSINLSKNLLCYYLSLASFFHISLECFSCQRGRRPAFHIVTAFFLKFASCSGRRRNRNIWPARVVREIVHVAVISFHILLFWSDIPFIHAREFLLRFLSGRKPLL